MTLSSESKITKGEKCKHSSLVEDTETGQIFCTYCNEEMIPK